MESNRILKEIHIKKTYMLLFRWYIEIEGFDLDNILIDENSYENILVYNISYKNLIDSKPLHIRFNKISVFIRVYDGTITFSIIWRWKIWFCLQQE